MTRDEVVEVMQGLVKKYGGKAEHKMHEHNGLPYVQFRILGWNNNLDFIPGSLSIHVLTVQSGGTGPKGRRPRVSRSEIQERFGIPEEALFHRVWGNGSYRWSVGLDYSLATAESLRVLLEWCLQKYGKKSDHAKYVHEKLCIDLMEELLGMSAERDVTPQWLSSGSRGNQRLDGYWEELRFAVEYHGLQHYEMVPYFHRDDETKLHEQKERDEKKRTACEMAGVDLIEVPYWVDLTLDNLLRFIKQTYPHIVQRLEAFSSTNLAANS